MRKYIRVEGPLESYISILTPHGLRSSVQGYEDSNQPEDALWAHEGLCRYIAERDAMRASLKDYPQKKLRLLIEAATSLLDK